MISPKELQSSRCMLCHASLTMKSQHTRFLSLWTRKPCPCLTMGLHQQAQALSHRLYFRGLFKLRFRLLHAVML